MYIVRFIREDKSCDENYFYLKKEDAQNHFNLFKTDDSGLYLHIDLIQTINSLETLIDTIIF